MPNGDTKLERIVHFRPAFDKRSDDPKKNYGIGSVQVTFALVDHVKKQAYSVGFLTGMFLPETVQEYAKDGRLAIRIYPERVSTFFDPMGTAVTYHDTKPHYEGQEVRGEVCDFIDVPCYSDSSFLAADKYLDALLREGSEKVWQMLGQELKEL